MKANSFKMVVFTIALMFIFATAHSETLIVVNCGKHRSADVTGHIEAKINWLDGNHSNDIECTESFAALELGHYLQKMTGNFDDFDPISNDDQIKNENLILLGNPETNPILKKQYEKLGLNRTTLGVDEKQLTDLGTEGYRIKSVDVNGRHVTIIVGGTRVGTLYGAYDFLHRLGCRWFGPGETNEEIPHIEKLSDMDVTERPSFALRRFHSFESRYQPETPDLFLWMARNRMNSWCMIDEMAPLMRKLGIQMSCGEHTAEALFVGPNLPYPYDYPLFKQDAKKPKDPYAVSKEYKGDFNKDGKLTYFEAHPEWYALVKGKRIPGIRKSASAKLGDTESFGHNYCTSNQDATTEFIKNYVQALIDGRYKNSDVVLFWTLDSGSTDTPFWCECENCKAQGSVTDRYLGLVYLFDKEVKKAQAAGKINRPIVTRFMIYRDVLKPPTRPLPADFDYQTCTGTFFPALRCYVHHFDDKACSINQKFQEQLYGWVEDPKRHYRGPVGIGEYYNIHRVKCLPLCLMHSMQYDIPYFYKHCGVRQFDYMHVTTENWGSKSLTNYQLARQLWNVDSDCEAMWKDYFSGRYGPAADTMRKFYEALEEVNFREIKSVLAGTLQKGEKQLFPSDHLPYDRESGEDVVAPTWLENLTSIQNCRELLDKAMKIKVSSHIKAHIAEDQGLFAYGEETLKYYDACVQAFLKIRNGDKEAAKKHYEVAKQIAEVLRRDTRSVAFSWDHAKKPNALEASSCEATLSLIEKLLSASEKSNSKSN